MERIKVALGRIRRGPYQKRRYFDREKLQELAESIRRQGVLHPPVVARDNGHFNLIMGERRWRANCALAISTEPGMDLERAVEAVCAGPPSGEVWPILDRITMMVEVSEGDSKQQHIQAIVDNVQREDLTPLEEAADYQSLLDAGLDLREVIQETGKSRTHIQESLRLLNLPEVVQAHIDRGRLPKSAGRHLQGLPKAQQMEIADKMAGRQWKEIKAVISLVKKRGEEANGVNGHEEKPLSAKKQVEELRKLLAALTVQIREDGKLLAACSEVLGSVDFKLAERAFDRSQEIERAVKVAVAGRK